VNLATIIEPHDPDAVALVAADEAVSYADLRARVADARGALSAAGVGRGDAVVVMAPNTPDTVVALLAVLGIGAVFVPLNPQSPPAEVVRELGLVSAAAAVGDLPVDPEVPVVDIHGSPSSPGDGSIVDVDPSAPALAMFTSGTAGAPRAALLSHANLLSNIDQTEAVADLRRRRDDVTLGLLPLFHVFGVNVVLLPALRAGGRVVLVDEFDPGGTAELVARHQVTLLTGPPTMWAALAAAGDAVDPSAFGSVRLAASGAAALPVSVARTVHERFGLVVHEGYGLTEASPVVATSASTDAPPGSIGRPLPGVEVRLLDVDGDDVLVGDVGHLHVRGPNVFIGYDDDPDATAAVLSADGWLRTGDLAVVDDDGYLFLVDRAKDLIIVSGFNVFPAEVEQVLSSHPTVADVAVHGLHADRTGEMVVADVVAAEDAPVDDDEWFRALDGHVGAHLSRYKCPSEYRRVATIPRGLGGKVQRRLLPEVEDGVESGGPAST
jgi:long-chain acyl-CoA synthetase